MPPVSAEALDDALHSRGLRATPQRRLVLEAVGQLGHATPEQVVEHVQAKRAPAATLNLSTVYRALELLEELGVVSHTHLSHGSPTYQVADHADHLHLVCRRCGQATEADLDLARPLAQAVAARHGFMTDLAHLSLHGICTDCRGEQQEPSASDRPGHDHAGHGDAGRPGSSHRH